MKTRYSLKSSKKLVCRPNSSVSVSSKELIGHGHEVFLYRTPCELHGLDCPSSSDKKYILFVRDVDTGRECSLEMNWSDLDCVMEDRGPISRIKVTLFTCEQFAGAAIDGFIVTSLTSSTSTSSLPPTTSSSTIIDQLAKLTLKTRRTVAVTVTRSTYYKASVQWTNMPSRSGRLPDKWLVTVSRINDVDHNTRIAHFYVDGEINELDLPLELSGGTEYRVKVKALRIRYKTEDCHDTVAEGSCEFRAELTLEDLKKLYSAAVEFSCLTKVGSCVKSATPCKWLYRNRWEEYFDDIDTTHGGIMEVYLKDNSGDQASPINSRLDGLFFMAKNDNSQPPRQSPFGKIRLQVPVEILLQNTPNLYFTDFYCMGGKIHYVTIVMTRPGTAADTFCRDRLLPLNLDDNPFLFRLRGKLYTANRKQLCIELFYTENIDMNDLVDHCGAVRTSGVPCPKGCKGRSTPGGIPKKSTCPKCNLPRNVGKYSSFKL